MFIKAILASLSALTLAFAAPSVKLEERQAPCESVHVFLARGTDEPYPGRQSALVSAICNGIHSCGYEDIMYPAAFTPSYCGSVSTGVNNGMFQIAAYASRCPNSKLVLSGYSQGAQAVGDILGGGGGSLFGCTQPTTSGMEPSTFPGNRIAAALFFGDVRHVPNQSYNTGTGVAGSGLFPRSGTQLSSLNRFSSKLRSWCLATDPVCAGGKDGNSHTTYFDLFSGEAGAWVKTKI